MTPTSHNHAASNITSGTLSVDRLPTVSVTKGGTGATTAAAARTNLGITPVNIGAAPAVHTHSLSDMENWTEITSFTGTITGTNADKANQHQFAWKFIDGRSPSELKLVTTCKLTVTFTSYNAVKGLTFSVRGNSEYYACMCGVRANNTTATITKEFARIVDYFTASDQMNLYYPETAATYTQLSYYKGGAASPMQELNSYYMWMNGNMQGAPPSSVSLNPIVRIYQGGVGSYTALYGRNL